MSETNNEVLEIEIDIANDVPEELLTEEELIAELEAAVAEEEPAPKPKKSAPRAKKQSNHGKILARAWVVFFVLLAAYVAYFFLVPMIPSVGENNTVELSIPKDANYKVCDDEDMIYLVQQYMMAKVACNQDILMDCVTDPTEFDDMTVLDYVAMYLRGFDNITCYMADGYAGGEYIVIALSNMRIANVDSHPLDIVTFYVITDDDGYYRIYNEDLDDERSAFLNEFKTSEYVQDIYVHVKESVEYYLTVDEGFAEFYSLIYGT